MFIWIFTWRYLYVYCILQTLGSKKGKYPKTGNPRGPGSFLTDEVLPESFPRLSFITQDVTWYRKIQSVTIAKEKLHKIVLKLKNIIGWKLYLVI